MDIRMDQGEGKMFCAFGRGFLTLSFFLFFSLSCAAAENFSITNFPKEFKYQNRPIDPICIDKMTMGNSKRFDPVSIDQCSRHPHYLIERVNEELIRKGFVGFDYSYQPSPGVTLHASSYYKYLGKFEDGYVIYAMQTTGGSGNPTALIYVKRTGNTLTLAKELAAGDRCNGGIDPGVVFKDKKVSYKIAITPFDILNLSGENTKNVLAYDDLTACAACCIGEAFFEHNFTQPKLLYVTLGKEAGNDEVYNQGKYQKCFNQVLREQMIKTNDSSSKFTSEDLKNFAQEFNMTCVK